MLNINTLFGVHSHPMICINGNLLMLKFLYLIKSKRLHFWTQPKNLPIYITTSLKKCRLIVTRLQLIIIFYILSIILICLWLTTFLFYFYFRLATGFPNCKTRQQWLVYHYRGSGDRLVLYPSGKLRHYVLKHQHGSSEEQQQQHRDFIVDHERSFDYEQGFYCLDKVKI